MVDHEEHVICDFIYFLINQYSQIYLSIISIFAKCIFLIYFFLSTLNESQTIFQSIQAAQKEHQGDVDDLNKMAEQVFQKAPPEICQKYRTELDNVMVRWRRVSEQLEENIQKLQDHMTKLQQFQARAETIC